MDLNSDAVDDLDQNEIDPTIISETGTIIQDESNDTSTDQTTLPMDQDDGSDPITDAAGLLNSISNTTESIYKVSDIKADIASNGAISKFDVELINQATDNDLASKVSTEEYTSFRSKTNFDYTHRFLSKKIISLESELITSTQSFISDNLLCVSKAVEMLLGNKAPQAVTEVTDMRAQHSEFITTIDSNPNLVVPYDGGFVNIVKQDIMSLDLTKADLPDLELTSNSKQVLVDAISNIQTIFKSLIFKSVFIAHSDDNLSLSLADTSLLQGKEGLISNIVQEVTIADIAKFYDNHRTLEFMSAISDRLHAIDKLIYGIRSKYQVDEVVDTSDPVPLTNSFKGFITEVEMGIEPTEVSVAYKAKDLSLLDAETILKDHGKELTAILTIELPFYKHWLMNVHQLSFYSTQVFNVLKLY
jgi:hypothetical protein